MDQTIDASFANCEALYSQLHFAQQVVVPMSLDYNFQGPDPQVQDFTDELAATATGQLVYVPFHTVRSDQQIPGTGIYLPRLGLIPATLSATIQGRGSAEVPGHGGDFSVPGIYVAISAAVAFARLKPTVAVKSTVRLSFNYYSPFDGATLPIQLTWADSKGDSSQAVLHLGPAVIVQVPPPVVMRPG